MVERYSGCGRGQKERRRGKWPMESVLTRLDEKGLVLKCSEAPVAKGGTRNLRTVRTTTSVCLTKPRPTWSGGTRLFPPVTACPETYQPVLNQAGYISPQPQRPQRELYATSPTASNASLLMIMDFRVKYFKVSTELSTQGPNFIAAARPLRHFDLLAST
jgi:hypothetical protein